MDKDIIYALELAKIRYERGEEFYLCYYVAKYIYNDINTRNSILIAKLNSDYPDFDNWIVEVGKKYRFDYKSGDAWTYDEREKYRYKGCDYMEDLLDDEECCSIFPLLTSADKAKEIDLLLTKIKNEKEN